MIDEKALDVAARAMSKRSGFALAGDWDAQVEHDQRMIDLAQAAITAYLGALEGVVLVPVVPSDKMLEAAYAADEAESTDWLNHEAGPIEAIYRAMIAARPQIEGE